MDKLGRRACFHAVNLCDSMTVHQAIQLWGGITGEYTPDLNLTVTHEQQQSRLLEGDQKVVHFSLPLLRFTQAN